LAHIEEEAIGASMGMGRVLGHSAGDRDIFLFEYGEKQELGRQANYGSACGARDPKLYADKRGARPVVLMVGAIHGGEMDAIAALINLIHVIETGEDWRGRRYPYISDNYSRVRLLLIPCMNPDGRARVPFDSFQGHGRTEAYATIQAASLCIRFSTVWTSWAHTSTITALI
jgi:murein tripeptide amidase MpaA